MDHYMWGKNISWHFGQVNVQHYKTPKTMTWQRRVRMRLAWRIFTFIAPRATEVASVSVTTGWA